LKFNDGKIVICISKKLKNTQLLTNPRTENNQIKDEDCIKTRLKIPFNLVLETEL